jgi:hypothetical protein
MHLAVWAALVGVGLLALPYIFFPILIKVNYCTPAQPSLLEFEISENPPPAHVTRYFERVETELAAKDFEVIGHFANHVEFGNGTMFLKLLENRRTNDASLVIVVFALPIGALVNPPPIKEQVISFFRRFDDGTEISTSNSNVAQIFKTIKGKRIFRFPQIQDSQTLFALHLCTVKEFGMSRAKPLPPHDRMADLLLEHMRAELVDQAAVGYLRLNETGDNYVATWKGAYLMTWSLLWPIKQWQLAARRRRAAELIQQWGPELSKDYEQDVGE